MLPLAPCGLPWHRPPGQVSRTKAGVETRRRSAPIQQEIASHKPLAMKFDFLNT